MCDPNSSLDERGIRTSEVTMARKRTTKREGADRLQQLMRVSQAFGQFRPASEVLTDVRAVPTRFVQLDHATRVGGWPIERFTLVHGPSNHGKAHPLDEVVLTPQGWRTFGEIRVGDQVIGSNGHSTMVIGVFPQGKKQIVSVVSDDGATARCCEDHLWTTTTVNELNRGRYNRGPRPERSRVLTGEVGEGSAKPAKIIAETLDEKHYLPGLSSPVEYDVFKSEELPLDPYYLGLLLGDGSFRGTTVSLASADEEIFLAIERVAAEHGDQTTRCDYGGCPSILVTGGERGKSKGSYTRRALQMMGLWGHRAETKTVPVTYLRASPRVRLLLLQGLMDTDGGVSNEGTQAQFSTSSPYLRDAVVELVRSLGGRAFTYPHETDCLPAWCVMVSFADSTNPFRIRRKADAWKPRQKALRQRIVAVESIGEAECVCIAVDAEDHLYVTRDFLLTHNTEFLLGLFDSFLLLDHLVHFIDAERTTPMKWTRLLMGSRADHPGFTAQRPDTYEGVMADVRNFCNHIIKVKASGDLAPDVAVLFGVDSLRKLVPKDLMKEILEAEKMARGGDIKGGKDRSAQVKARMNAAWMDEVVPLLEKAGAGMVVIGREMQDPDADQAAKDWGNDYKIGGGGAIFYDSSLVVRVERAGYVQLKREGQKGIVYGERHRLTIRKTKIGGKDDKTSVAYYHTSNGTLTPEGFDRGRDVLELAERFGIVTKAGSSYSYDGQRIGAGQHNVAVKLADEPELLERLEQDVRGHFAQQKPLEFDPETGEIP